MMDGPEVDLTGRGTWISVPGGLETAETINNDEVFWWC
jgi:hypothetical protein